MNIPNKNILVTGGKGFLGQHLVHQLEMMGVPKGNIKIPDSRKNDLRKKTNCQEMVKDVDLVFHLAGNVGGIGYNQKYPGRLFYDNLVMGVELMEAARLAKVEKFVAVGTICSYPKFTPVPFKEDNLWEGYPEETNAPYGLAKKMLLVQAQAYRQEYGFNSIHLLPVNLYGPKDNFDDTSSHVIPAIIKKIDHAIQSKSGEVVVWGTGNPTREFLYVEDAAMGLILAAKRYNKSDPVNLGSGQEISISDLVRKIAAVMKYEGEIIFDSSKPDGQPRRALDTSKAESEFGFRAQTDFDEGLVRTIDWFHAHQS